MITRRGFFGRLGSAVAGAALAAHMELHSLVPVLDFEPPPRPWYYLIEETYPVIVTDKATGLTYRNRMKHVRWIEEAEMAELGLKHEDFADSWDGALPEVGKTIEGRKPNIYTVEQAKRNVHQFFDYKLLRPTEH